MGTSVSANKSQWNKNWWGPSNIGWWGTPSVSAKMSQQKENQWNKISRIIIGGDPQTLGGENPQVSQQK